MSNITVGQFAEGVGDGEFSPGFLRNHATGRSVPKPVPEFNWFLYRPTLLTREVKLTKLGHYRCFQGARTRISSV